MRTLTTVQTKGWKAFFLILTPFLVLIGVGLLQEGLRQRKNASLPEYTGRVVASDYTMVFGVMRRPVLTIQVDGSSEAVSAVLMTNSADKIPQRVSFHWSGEPGAEVGLKQETNAWIFAIIALLGGPMGLGLVHLFRPGGPFSGASAREEEI